MVETGRCGCTNWSGVLPATRYEVSNNWSCGWKSSKRTARRPAQPRVQRQPLLSLITAPAGKPARRALPEHLPRETETHAPKQSKCDCGGELRKLGEDVSEVPEYVRA